MVESYFIRFLKPSLILVLDLDECLSNSHSCDANAVCSNTHGSHHCTCKPGFSGDGRSCAGNIFPTFVKVISCSVTENSCWHYRALLHELVPNQNRKLTNAENASLSTFSSQVYVYV